jgi:hypothetical protein
MTSPGGLSVAQVEELVGRYRAGESIRDLAASYDRAYTTMRRALLYAGVDMRSRGGDHYWHQRSERGLKPGRRATACQDAPSRPGVRVESRKRGRNVMS